MTDAAVGTNPNMGTVMYEQIQREVTNDPYYQQNFPNDGQRFVAWYLRRVMLRDPIETRDDITDGANDKQMDAVVVDDGPPQRQPGEEPDRGQEHDDWDVVFLGDDRPEVGVRQRPLAGFPPRSGARP